MPDRVAIVGAGYVGSALALELRRAGIEVVAFTRSSESARPLEERGILVHRLDFDDPATLPPSLFAGFATVHYLAPPPPGGSGDPRLRRFLDLLSTSPPARLVYVSTSGVYGDCGGAWVDETWPLNATTDRARRRVDAENACREFGASSGVELAVLRVPGIYGPGRLPVERVRARVPILREDESPFTNRIHRDDLVRALDAAGRAGGPVGAFNVSDGHPTTMADYFRRLADLIGVERPPEVSREEAETVLTPELLSFLRESRRLVIRRMREELKVEPRHPDLATGLAASWP